MGMKPSELIAVLQQAVDAGYDELTEIYFDTEAREFNYHMAKVGSAHFDTEVAEALEIPYFISLHEERKR